MHEFFFFFFLFFAANTRTLQRSDAVQSRTPLSFRKGLIVGGVSLWAESHCGRGLVVGRVSLWANPVPGANLHLDFGAFQFCLL